MIGIRPCDVREHDQDQIWAKLSGNNFHRPRKTSLVGKMARISTINGYFEKGYLPNWGE